MARPRYLAAVGVAAVAAAMVVGMAGATTNVAPNPSFSADCSGVPCSWNHHSAQAAVATETTNVHSAPGSYRVDTIVSGTGSGSSDCFQVSFGAGGHDVSFFYNNSNPNILASATRIELVFFSGTNCNTFLGGAEVFGTGTSGWQIATGKVNVPLGTTSMFVTFYASCTNAGPCSGYYDDVDIEAEVTAVTLSSFAATRSAKGVAVRWHTGTETGTLGFHVYRSRGGKLTRVDRHLVRAQGSVGGARYSFLDRRAPRGKLTYRLQAVGTGGSRTWYGRASVSRR